MNRRVSRRDFLASTALIGAGALATLVLGGRAALALSLQEADEETNRLYLSACSATDRETHDALLREAREKLDGRLSESEIRAELAKLTCPVCGCPILPG